MQWERFGVLGFAIAMIATGWGVWAQSSSSFLLDVAVSKTPDTDFPQTVFDYEMAVTNTGEDPLEFIAIEMSAPGWDLVTIGQGGGLAQLDSSGYGGIISWPVPSEQLFPGDTSFFTMTAAIPEGSTREKLCVFGAAQVSNGFQNSARERGDCVAVPKQFEARPLLQHTLSDPADDVPEIILHADPARESPLPDIARPGSSLTKPPNPPKAPDFVPVPDTDFVEIPEEELNEGSGVFRNILDAFTSLWRGFLDFLASRNR